MDFAIEILSWTALLSGSVFLIIGAVGTVRFPDFWSRLHAVSVTDSAGVILLILGMILQAGLTLVTVKLVIIGVFLFITGPTATHAVANAALVSGLLPEGIRIPRLNKPIKRSLKNTKPKSRARSRTGKAKR